MRYTCLLLIHMFAFATVAFAQNFSNKGTDFWAGYGLHFTMEEGDGLGNAQNMVLQFSAEQRASVKVTITGEAPVTGNPVQLVRNYTVPANGTLVTDYMPKSGMYDCRLYDLEPSFDGRGLERIYNRSIHIESDVPIVAYAYVGADYASAASMLIPTESWGYSYISANSFQITPGSVPGNGCLSWAFVIADHDNTEVEITPSVPLRRGAPANQAFKVTLNKGQIYQLVGAPVSRNTGRDLTGTKIKSVANSAGTCYPIAVFSGSNVATITCNQNAAGYADNLFQQAFPVQAWGKLYVTAPFSSSNNPTISNSTIYRVLVKDASAVVKRNGAIMTGLVNGTYYEFVSKTADLIEADQPVMVIQYMPSRPQPGLGAGGCDWDGLGDPDMVYLSPLEQAIKKVTLFRNASGIFTTNFLTLIIPTLGLTSLSIDGTQNFGHVYAHPNMPGYSVVVKSWPAANAQCSVQSDSAFTSITYGVGRDDSYAYNGGAMINNLNGIPQLHNPEAGNDVVHLYTCEGTPAELSILTIYQPTRLEWRLSEVTGILPAQDVILNNPTSVAIVTIKGTNYYKYTLPGTYKFEKTGLYRIPVKSSHPVIDNCNHTEDFRLEVEVRDRPGIDFTYLHEGCSAEAATLTWDANSSGSYVVKKWLWTFPDGKTADTKNASKAFNVSGEHEVNLKVVTEEGCVADTTKKVIISGGPSVEIEASALELCEGSTVHLEAVVPGGEDSYFTGWYWDLGDGKTANTKVVGDYLFQQAGTYHLKMAGKSGTVCVSDTARTTIKVYANPTSKFTYPAGCLPENGVVPFVSEASAADGQSIAAHAWNFGDPAANAANPNTSAEASPSHTYRLGNFTISYAVTTEKGCRKDTVVHAKFSVKPQFNFPALASVCENVPAFSVAKATITNGVSGAGIYKGKGTDAAGNFNPAAAGPGTHIIRYVFTTDGGCIDSVDASISVHALPTAAFSVTEEVCQDKGVVVTDQSSAVSSSLNSWKWDLGDGSNAIYNNGNVFTKTYANAGAYKIKLIVTDVNGCTSEVTEKTTTVHPMPKAVFTSPDAVCVPGEAIFTNQSQTPDNSVMQYKWNMGDGSANITTKDARHTYSARGNYNISLEVTTAYGCVNTLSRAFAAFYDRPAAAFKVVPEAACQGAEHSFTDNSSSANGSITGWKWNFADGTMATVQMPAKSYKEAGAYSVSLVVTDDKGCTSLPAVKPVKAYVQPVIDAGDPVSVVKGAAVVFAATANKPEALQFTWTPAAELTNANTLRPSFIATHDEVFTLTATSTEGHCTATDQLVVKALTIINPPNSFTPNGDGIHDKWIIEGLSEYGAGVTVQVFNRYGQQVYSAKGYSVPWDGTSNNKLLPAGTYYYMITAPSATWKRIAGPVTIIR
ncbi:PKD domain-containing protein [Filimonas effusa]|uniref:PKD domain-containing protein n=1 Tax=Filimonas effusa TaxID=2508721 RepID=A0A4Q1D4Y7_9BACT|nr:PKD domain-containing protein [Filimonas effusa]RXK83530.1 PKD domain-containing protein [Filimonas effusa]